jgi:hypothetical protein
MEHITHNGHNILTHMMIELLIAEYQATPDPVIPRELFTYFAAQFVAEYESHSLLVATARMMKDIRESSRITRNIEFANVPDMSLADRDEIGHHAATMIAGGIIVDMVLALVEE